MIEFGYPEHSIPHYRQKSHVHPDNLSGEDEYCLLPNLDCHSIYTHAQPMQSG